MARTIRFGRTIDGRRVVGDGEGFVPVSAVLPGVTSIVAAARNADAIDIDAAPAERIPATALSFGTPFEPRKLWGIGLNYADHAADLKETTPDEPASFLKPHTAIAPPDGPIRLPDVSDRVTAEAELGVVIGHTCSHVTPDRVSDVIAGFVPVIDMTAEDILERNPRFLTRAKSFDSFFIFGPHLVVPSSGAGVVSADTMVRTEINGETIAENTIDHMRHSPAELVAFHSRGMTLEPGDVISTGTPGAGVIRSGDRIRAIVSGVGELDAIVK